MKKNKIKYNYFFSLPIDLILYIFSFIPKTRNHFLILSAKSVS